MVEILNPKTMHVPVGEAYGHVSKAKPKTIIYVAGQVPVDDNGKIVGMDEDRGLARMEIQSKQVFENLTKALEAAGAKPSDVIKTNTYVTDMEVDAPYVELRKKYFKGKIPPGTLVEVKRLYRKGFMIEMEAVAALE